MNALIKYIFFVHFVRDLSDYTGTLKKLKKIGHSFANKNFFFFFKKIVANIF